MDYTDEFKLIQNIRENAANAGESLRKLDEMHGGIFYMVYNSILKRYQSTTSGYEVEDFKDNKLNMIYQCVQSFDETKGWKFATFYSKSVRYNAYKLQNKIVKKMGQSSLENFEEHGGTLPTEIDYQQLLDRNACDYALEQLEERGMRREAEYIREYYLKGKNLEEIGNREDLTKERVRQVIFSGLKTIRNPNIIKEL